MKRSGEIKRGLSPFNLLIRTKKSIKASLYERTASPIAATFVSAWLIINWKLCLILALGNDSIYNRISFVERGLYLDIWPNFYAPLISASVFLVCYPLVSIYAYKWWEWYAKKKADVKNSMQRGVLLSLEKSIELRNEIDSQEAKFEEMLKGKEQKNAELLVIHDNLKKVLKEKELEISNLQQQLKSFGKNRSLKSKTAETTLKDVWPIRDPKLIRVDRVKKVDTVKAPAAEKISKETEWDKEYEGIVSRNPQFPQLLDQALEASVDRYKHLNNSAKKACLIHGAIELDDGGEVKVTEKGKYMAKKIV